MQECWTVLNCAGPVSEKRPNDYRPSERGYPIWAPDFEPRLHGKDCSYNPFAFPPSMAVRRRRYESRDGRGRAKQDARAESNAWSGCRGGRGIEFLRAHQLTLETVAAKTAIPSSTGLHGSQAPPIRIPLAGRRAACRIKGNNRIGAFIG